MKFKPFLLLIIFSAMSIAGTAALFSVTGIASLFSGHYITVAAMAAVLEIGKLIAASFLYRHWDTINKLFKFYLVSMVLILMIITSAGIFGYLSEAYQDTKGDYTLVEKQVNVLKSKKQVFVDRKERLQNDKDLEIKTKESNQVRADSLTAQGISITRTRNDIKESEDKIVNLENRISAMEDSIGTYDLKIIDLESKNIQGELGPLSYIAGVFGTDMDTAVKYFIFLLIFVFDPLAVSLVIAANITFSTKFGTRKEFTEALSFNNLSKKNKDENITELNNKSTEITEDSNSSTHQPSESDSGSTVEEKNITIEDETKQSKPMLDKKFWPKKRSANWKPPHD